MKIFKSEQFGAVRTMVDDQTKEVVFCLLDDLPERFTLEEVIAVRRRNNLPAEQTVSMLANWKHREYITEDEGTGVWRKCAK